MRKPKRKKVHREWLENQLAKCERRIQKIAETAYHFRQAIEILDRQEITRNESKGEMTDALYQASNEGLISAEQSNSNTGKSDIFDPTITQEILDKQSTELSDNR